MNPRIVDAFPHVVRQIENCWIPLPDGVRLAARVWLPYDANRQPVPAILEYLPYRKRDFTRGRDEPVHHYFAGHGYAAVRVDVRGSGDSDGILLDEYSAEELADGAAVIAWIAAQPWCSGAVGMMGISWGGFNALQVAALRPPALRAIITLCSSDDRYADDAHYMGGCLLNENLTWGSVLMSFQVCPPDPEIVGPRWRSMWMERLRNAVLFPAHWLRHQRRDAFWQRGSVCEDYARIACPVYAMGGWADAYANTVPRLMANLTVPCKGLIGPWAHMFPHDGVPAPRIGFLQEAIRWWDHWLKGIDTGLMREPRYRVWMQESVAPATFHAERPGRWVAEAEWPSPRIVTRRSLLALRPSADGDGVAGVLVDEAGGGLHRRGVGLATEAPAAPPRQRSPLQLSTLQLSSPQQTGVDAGDWCCFGGEGEMPGDQRADDARSATFDSPPLTEPLEILGAPAVTLVLASDRPHASIAVRLCDVAADGASTRVTYGLLDLTHRYGHERAVPLEPGKRCSITLRLNDVAHAFAVGHRVRLAISTSYWPIAWPAPAPCSVTLHMGTSVLELPVRPPGATDDGLRPFAPAEQAPLTAQTMLHPSAACRTVVHDPSTGDVVYEVLTDGGDLTGSVTRLDDIGLELGYSIARRYRIHPDDPLSARAEVVQRTTFRRGSWSIRLELRTEQRSTAHGFVVQAQLTAHESDQPVFERRWDEHVPRDIG